LDGTYTADTVFAATDHRSHRKQEWLAASLRKVGQLDFLYGKGAGRTIGQAALQFVLAQPTVSSVLPNILNEEQLREFAAAPDTPPLTEEESARLRDLYDRNFGVEKEPVAAEEPR